MATVKAQLARGVRDFDPEFLNRRKWLFSQLEEAFMRYGFLPLETPAIELNQTLQGAYGEEGDRLIFRILNSGQYLESLTDEDWTAARSGQINRFTRLVTEKALRFDLTVPFARYVSMNRGNMVFPFKRFQMQPVWRADRPQRGRYREFYQCDADLIGSECLSSEAQMVALYAEVLGQLGFPSACVRISHRKILSFMAEALGLSSQSRAFMVQLDKLDKSGKESMSTYLTEQGVSTEVQKAWWILIEAQPAPPELLALLLQFSSITQSDLPASIMTELETLTHYIEALRVPSSFYRFDLSLARGLDYYTGFIFEVDSGVKGMGSVGGGGRYDNLTASFGVDGLSGVGISFGVERILDLMIEQNLFGDIPIPAAKVLMATTEPDSMHNLLACAQELRTQGIKTDLYAGDPKPKKIFQYAEARQIPVVAILKTKAERELQFVLKRLTDSAHIQVKPQEIQDWVQGNKPWNTQ
ncbi:MAG: histidine--tRNA ligase [Sphingomonadales bacterium]|nr:histidine--tRNA ligase [Sphingomonadales bacterium]